MRGVVDDAGMRCGSIEEVLEEMRDRETFAAGSLLRREVTHAVTLMAAAASLFVVLGTAGLLIDQLAGLVGAELQAKPVLLGSPNKVHRPQLLTAGPSWLSPGEVYTTREESSASALISQAEGQVGFLEVVPEGATPLVLIASGLDALEAAGEQELLLEPDGSLRIEASGTLVGFLQSGQRCELGDVLSGPGLIEFKLLHYGEWVAEHVSVPIVEPNGDGRWVVRGFRGFGVGVQGSSAAEIGGKTKEPELNARTGLPLVELLHDPR